MSYLAIPNYRNILNFILFLSIFLASVFYVFVSELHLVRIMVPLVLIVTIFRMDGKLIVPHYIRHILLLLLAYLFYMYAITLLNNRGISVNDFVNYSFLYLMTVAVFLQFSNDAQKTAAVLFYAALAFYLMNIGLGYYEYMTGWHLPQSAVLKKSIWVQHIPTTFYTNQNDFSTMHFLIFLYLYKYSEIFLSPGAKKIILLLFPISLFLYIVTSSKIVLISILIWMIFEFRLRMYFKLFLSLLFAILILAIIFPSFYSKLFDVVEHFWLAEATLESSSTDVRLALYENGLRSISESYGLGFGINASSHYYAGLNDPALGGIIDAHGYIVELIVNGGLVALLGYIGLVGYMTSILHKKQRVTFIMFSLLYTFLLFSSSSSLYLWGHYLIFVGYWYILIVKHKKARYFNASFSFPYKIALHKSL